MDTNRFNNPKYKQKINAVRGYKRQTKKTSENKFSKFFSYLQTKTALALLSAGVVLVLCVYAIYFAPFLRVTHLVVNGANDTVVQILNEEINHFITGRRLGFLPQKSIVIFSTKQFSDYIQKNNFEISKVNTVKKHLSGEILIDVVQRVPDFILESNGHSYILNSDGNISTENSDPAQTGLVRILDLSNTYYAPGEYVYNLSRMHFLEYIQSNIKNKTSFELDNFEITSKESGTIIIKTKAGPKFYFDLNSDPEVYLQRLFTLWTNLPADQQKKLYYIDMRFTKNAYVCLVGDACAKQSQEAVQKTDLVPNSK